MRPELQKKHDYICSKLGLEEIEIIDSPVIRGYRNSQAYTFGLDESGKQEIGLYRERKSTIVNPCELDLCGSDLAKKVARTILRWIESKGVLLRVINKESLTGFWRHVHIKENSTGEYLIVLQVLANNSHLNLIWNELQSSLADYLIAQTDPYRLVGVYQQITKDLKEAVPTDPFYTIYRTVDLIMYMDSYKFKRSPASFFQPNAYTASIIYKRVKEMALTAASEDTYLLDVCCGTGTIGIYMANKFKHIFGVDRTVSAIRDARENATLNDVNNATYLAGNAEDVVPKIIEKNGLEDKKIVAVVNPPRRGLYPAVLEALNDCKYIQTLIYISCNVDSLKRDMDLLRYKTMVKSFAIDQFPNTDHCETIIKLSEH